MANRQDKTHGTVFERRFKSVAVLDDEAHSGGLRQYIDLNPVAAGIVTVPEASPHTSIKTGLEHVHEQGRTSDLAAAAGGGVEQGHAQSAGLEESLWLCPIEDRRWNGFFTWRDAGKIFAGKLSAPGRLHRPAVPRRKGHDFARALGDLRSAREQRGELVGTIGEAPPQPLLGRFFAASRERLREVATRLGVHHLATWADARRDRTVGRRLSSRVGRSILSTSHFVKRSQPRRPSLTRCARALIGRR